MGSADTASHVDVLIVGAGPAGMMASLYLSELGTSHRIIDHRGTRTLNGRADGFAGETVAIWESFGIYDYITKFSQTFGNWTLWTHGEEGAPISRQIRSYFPGASNVRLRTGTMSQGMTEAALRNGSRARNGPEVERGAKPIALDIDESKVDNPSSYPITVQVNHVLKSELPDAWTGAHSVQEDGSLKRERGLIEAFGTDPHEIEQHVSGPEGTTEVIRAKYVIGADGAHSWVRRQLPGFQMEGDTTPEVFGVVDIIAQTDFPDIRKACSVFSKAGFGLLIPRENEMTRIYVQFPPGYVADETNLRQQDWQSAVADIMRHANNVLSPYTISYKYCDWFTIFRINQRVCNNFSHLDRIFLAGDAVHTHSPKTGQGMNISQQDAHSLAWKIAGVLRGQFSSKILQTYEEERLHVARLLIEMDKAQVGAVMARLKGDKEAIMRSYGTLAKFYAAQRYAPSTIVAEDGKDGATQEAAQEMKLGDRVKDAWVFNQASGTEIALHTLLKSDGLWRLLVFAGDVSDKARLAKVNALGDRLAALQSRYASLSARKTAFLETLLFHSCALTAVEIADLHSTFFPDLGTGVKDYDKTFGDSDGIEQDAFSGAKKHEEKEKGAHEVLGIDKERGALVLVRPDRIVAWVGFVEDLEGLEGWFGKFMIGKDTK